MGTDECEEVRDRMHFLESEVEEARAEAELLREALDRAHEREREAIAQRDAARADLGRFTEWVERDRREPDKLLCHVTSMRRAAADAEIPYPSRTPEA